MMLGDDEIVYLARVAEERSKMVEVIVKVAQRKVRRRNKGMRLITSMTTKTRTEETATKSRLRGKNRELTEERAFGHELNEQLTESNAKCEELSIQLKYGNIARECVQ